MTDRELCFLGATELASLLRARRVSPVEVVEALLARIDAVERPDAGVRPRLPRAGAGGGARGRDRDRCRARSRAAPRHSRGVQGHLRRAGRADDGGLAAPPGERGLRGLHGGGSAAAGGGDLPGEAEHLRVRIGEHGGVRACAEPLELDRGARRLERRLGGGPGGWPDPAGHRQRYRGLGADPCRLLRRRRPSTHLRAGQPGGHHPAQLEPGSRGARWRAPSPTPPSSCRRWPVPIRGTRARRPGQCRSTLSPPGISPACGLACRARTSSRGRTRRSWPRWTLPSTPCGSSGPSCGRSTSRTLGTGPRPPGRSPTRGIRLPPGRLLREGP